MKQSSETHSPQIKEKNIIYKQECFANYNLQVCEIDDCVS